MSNASLKGSTNQFEDVRMNIADRNINALQSLTSHFTQSENAALTYTVNYASTLATDTISTSTWSSEDTGVTIASDTSTTTTASARLSGSPGAYAVINKIVTAAGDTIERTIKLTVTANEGSAGEDYE